MNNKISKWMAGVAAICIGTAYLSTAAYSVSAKPAVVTVDTTVRGEAISPYIYGQFIEHLGECIYGGIWAEMLQDRKFFFPVTGEAPAWESGYNDRVQKRGDGKFMCFMRTYFCCKICSWIMWRCWAPTVC